MALEPALRSFFDTVRTEAGPAIWSQGVTMARTANISTVKVQDDEVVLKVRMPVELVSRTVTLLPEDEDWLCDCKAPGRVCEHAAAAVIAWKSALEKDEPLPAAGGETVGRIVYRLERANGGLRLIREVHSSKGAVPLLGNVAAAALANRGVKLSPEPLDYEIETVLGHRPLAWIPPGQMVAVLRPLGRVKDLTLEGRPVTTALQPVGAVIRVEDGPQAGFMVTVLQDDAITEVFNNGVVLCGDRLQPLGESGLSARELESWRGGRLYRGNEVAALVTEVLPSLEKRARLDIRTRRLPTKSRELPRLELDAETVGHELHVLPTLVYGRPAVARVDGDQLVLLKNVLPIRDESEERRLKKRLESQLGLQPGQRLVVKGEAAVAFAARLRRFDGDVDGELDSFFLAPPMIPRISVDDDGGFDVAFEVPGLDAGRGRRADAGTVLGAFRDGANLVPLLGGGWSPLPADWLRKHGGLVQDLLVARGDGPTLPPAAVPDLARLCRALDLPSPPAFDRLRALVDDFDRLPSAALPADLTATLRDYQRKGVDWLDFLRSAGLGALLADDMGLGKTIQAMAVFAGRTLVVAPTSVVFNWANELARFRPGLRVSTYQGPKRALDPDADVTLTSYALLRLDADLLAGVAWDTVVLDEAQAIKNPDSQVARAAFRLRAGFRATLTGTPVENRLDELWSQFHFINRGLLGSRDDFEERYSRPIAAGEPGVAARLRERIRPFLLRRRKVEVAPELPSRTEVVLRCELTERERALYDAIRAATQEDVVSRLNSGGGVFEALEALLRLRQAACHSGLVPGGEAESSSKVELLVEQLVLAASEGHKALVFSQWTGLLDRIEPHLDAAGLSHIRLDGSTRDREAVVNDFQREDGPPVLLLSLKAGGTGLNLTAADNVFLVDPWWNPAAEDQAADRAHRIGQTRPVLVTRLVAADTVEERILELQRVKRTLAEAALGEGGQGGELSRADLLGLLA